jgi:translation initiation factor IF-3
MQTVNNQLQQQYRVRINQYIRVPQVRVILSNGENGGIMPTYEALKLAREEGLDLIEINPKAVPPVTKIADFGKVKYQEKKQQQAAKKKQVVQELKELTFKPNIAENDLNHKLEQAKGFLEDGNQVKFTVKFRGREIVHAELGKQKIEWLIQQLDNLIAPNPQINLEGKFMSVIVLPVKKQGQY